MVSMSMADTVSVGAGDSFHCQSQEEVVENTYFSSPPPSKCKLGPPRFGQVFQWSSP